MAKILTGTVTTDIGSIAHNSETTFDVGVTGALTASTPAVSLGWSVPLGAGLFVAQAYVSAANVVTVIVRNESGGAVDPPSLTCRATIFQY